MEVREDQFNPENVKKGQQLLSARHMVNVQEHRDKNCTVIKAECIPEMSIRKKRYNVEFHVEESSRKVEAAHCSCTAGVSGQCNHAACLYLFINHERSLGKTDEVQVWSAPSQKVQDLYPKGEKIRKIFHLPEIQRPTFKKSKEEQRKLAEDMAMHGLSGSCLFKSLSAEKEADEFEEEHIAPEVPAEVHALFQKELLLSVGNLQPKDAKEVSFFKEYVVCSNTTPEIIFRETIGQWKNKKWFKHKQYRISASRCHKISRARPENRTKYLVGTHCDHPNMRYGREMEECAKKKYVEVTGNTVFESGLFVKSSQPFLCASPDSLIKDGNGNMMTLEIKCPSSCKDKNINVPYLDETGLKPNHEYYSQVQLQMYCANVEMCHFFVFSEVDWVQIVIPRDDSFL